MMGKGEGRSLGEASESGMVGEETMSFRAWNKCQARRWDLSMKRNQGRD